MKLQHQLLGVLLALALACLPVPANAAAASAGEYFDYIDLADGNKADYCGALYSDSMLLADAEALSTDLVKVSAMLATAAYQRDEVVDLQKKLIELGRLSGKADGDFGSKTETAIKLAQGVFGLEETGVADNEFQQKLFAAQPASAETPAPETAN